MNIVLKFDSLINVVRACSHQETSTVYPLVKHCGWLGSMVMPLTIDVYNLYSNYLVYHEDLKVRSSENNIKNKIDEDADKLHTSINTYRGLVGSKKRLFLLQVSKCNEIDALYIVHRWKGAIRAFSSQVQSKFFKRFEIMYPILKH